MKSVKPGPVCSVDAENIHSASDDCLRLLLTEIGRNGETKNSKSVRSKVEKELLLRKKNGVTINSDGSLHHPV